MKAFAFAIAVLLMVASISARADGPLDGYDDGAPPAIARTLSPNEYVINADGASEDPDHRMSDVARAYRNGVIAGRQEEVARQRRIIAEQNARNDATTDYVQANPPLPLYQQPSVQYVQQQPQPMYVPVPSQQYVYAPPPAPRIVVSVGIPFYRALPTGQWPQGYRPVWPHRQDRGW
ncbi:hypothetical protein AWB81_07390 [Caballeronia arationis]|uniref:hypothetical protein n=1 Tax=Caballeronia arationis TaxID=1777142 RepID=UPI00074C1DA0|nr:hypothetical protein [Caballeronia arationis]SAL05976.1 hypothetical protein AWB81_07390 [Caballeronia arationis]